MYTLVVIIMMNCGGEMVPFYLFNVLFESGQNVVFTKSTFQSVPVFSVGINDA